MEVTPNTTLAEMFQDLTSNVKGMPITVENAAMYVAGSVATISILRAAAEERRVVATIDRLLNESKTFTDEALKIIREKKHTDPEPKNRLS